MQKTILVTGSAGQLGQSLRALSANYQAHWLFVDRTELDITNLDRLKSYFNEHTIDICINCAAYTGVDKAESDPETCFAVNEQAVKQLIYVCNTSNTLLVHISSDYVYNSVSIRPLIESDECKPRGVYARSKRAGELAIITGANQWLIFRVSWLYSEYGQNFVNTMLRLGSERESLSIVSDQMGTPTYALDFAQDLLSILLTSQLNTSALNQIYNYSNLGVTHWAAFAHTIFKYADLQCKINEVTTKEYGALAPRPLWSVMDKTKGVKAYGWKLLPWEEALKKCLNRRR